MSQSHRLPIVHLFLKSGLPLREHFEIVKDEEGEAMKLSIVETCGGALLNSRPDPLVPGS